MRYKYVCIVGIILLNALSVCAEKVKIVGAGNAEYVLKSPDGTLQVSISAHGQLTYSVAMDGHTLMTDCPISLNINGREIGKNARVRKTTRKTTDEILRPIVPLKNATVHNHYNSLALTLADGNAVEFRAYDNGIAYRFATSSKDSAIVYGETAELNFCGNYKAHMSSTGRFRTGYESHYRHMPLSEFKSTDEMTYLPVLIETDKQYKILISESDIRDYPSMFLCGTGANAMKAAYPPYVLQTEPEWDRSLKITKEAEYIARTSGRRSYPWRYFVISRQDKDIVANEMIRCLAGKNEIDNTSWIKPGQVSWDWWNHKMIWGVDFEAGINTNTYKYYIDFASRFGVPYIIMDEGWAKSTTNPYETIREIDLPELIRYGKERGVGIILWLPWLTVENHMDLFARYEEWGIPGVKIDFMDRSDQWMVNYYERVAKEAARHHVMVDFHGSFKPSGLEYRYPNVLSYEAVLGLEQNENCRPENSIYLPFIRNAVGPMDFTPGAMISAQPEHNRCSDPNPMACGTRAYQMALYIVFESGTQMLADSPTRYYAEQACTEFITSVPVTWDETKVLDARLGEYVVVARRKGKQWFVGAITGEHAQKLPLQLDFLEKDHKYHMTSFEDGANASRQAMDYRKRTQDVDNTTKITMSLARNGGWCAVIGEE